MEHENMVSWCDCSLACSCTWNHSAQGKLNMHTANKSIKMDSESLSSCSETIQTFWTMDACFSTTQEVGVNVLQKYFPSILVLTFANNSEIFSHLSICQPLIKILEFVIEIFCYKFSSRCHLHRHLVGILTEFF